MRAARGKRAVNLAKRDRCVLPGSGGARIAGMHFRWPEGAEECVS
jgi:hypothetical protein